MTGRRSAWPGWVAVVAVVAAWDLWAPRHGRETLSGSWRRWRSSCPLAATGLTLAVAWLDHHLEATP